MAFVNDPDGSKSRRRPKFIRSNDILETVANEITSEGALLIQMEVEVGGRRTSGKECREDTIVCACMCREIRHNQLRIFRDGFLMCRKQKFKLVSSHTGGNNNHMNRQSCLTSEQTISQFSQQ